MVSMTSERVVKAMIAPWASYPDSMTLCLLIRNHKARLYERAYELEHGRLDPKGGELC